MNTAARLPLWRRRAWWGVVAAVLVLHAWVGREVSQSWLGQGAHPAPPPPIEVAFVQEMKLAAPPVYQPPAPRAAPAAAPVAQPAASQPDVVEEPKPEPEPEPPPPPPNLEETAAAPTAVAAAAASVPASAVPAAPAFDWPASTRLNFDLRGHFRGPLYGTAQVDWRRQGERYQVDLVVRVSPVFERRMQSDGVLGPNGLTPRRYDQVTDSTFAKTKQESLLFESDFVQLANGKTAPAPVGVQDTASQFVQMTWLFLTRPDLMQVGGLVEFPLALPRRVSTWRYDVVGKELLKLPFGEVETFHLKPRLEQRRPNELSVEMWMAPGLQYLPVRIFIQQDAETHLELTLKQAPLQAGTPAR